MIRKTIIVVLTLAAIFTGGLGWIGFRWGAYIDCSITGRWCFYVYSADGLVRLYAFGADEAIYLSPSRSNTYLSVRRAVDDEVCVRFRHATPPQIRPYAFFWREPLRAGRRGGQPAIFMSGFRTWIGLPVGLLLAYPLVAVVWERLSKLRRPKAGHCPDCAYDLTGNTSGVCSECGGDIEKPR